MHIHLSREFETGYSISQPLGVKYVVTSVQSEIVNLHWFSFIVVRSTVVFYGMSQWMRGFLCYKASVLAAATEKTPFALS
jgi:hypothetical protein